MPLLSVCHCLTGPLERHVIEKIYNLQFTALDPHLVVTIFRLQISDHASGHTRPAPSDLSTKGYKTGQAAPNRGQCVHVARAATSGEAGKTTHRTCRDPLAHPRRPGSQLLSHKPNTLGGLSSVTRTLVFQVFPTTSPAVLRQNLISIRHRLHTPANALTQPDPSVRIAPPRMPK